MLDRMFKTGDVDSLKRGLEAVWRTHREVTQNLANVDTPGYVARDTDFRALLVREDHSRAGQPSTTGFDPFTSDLAEKTPGVNIEKEMARLSQATLEQASLVKLLSSRYQGLLTAIREGK